MLIMYCCSVSWCFVYSFQGIRIASSYLKANFHDSYNDDKTSMLQCKYYKCNFFFNCLCSCEPEFISLCSCETELERIFASKVMEILHIQKKRKEKEKINLLNRKKLWCVLKHMTTFFFFSLKQNQIQYKMWSKNSDHQDIFC